MKLAEEAELDLVKIAPTAKPPVCKIIDYGKYRYELARKEKWTEILETCRPWFPQIHIQVEKTKNTEKANQRSVVEIDTLEKINAELIATLKETVQIQKEGEANREAAQVKMRQIESDLNNALLENAQQM